MNQGNRILNSQLLALLIAFIPSCKEEKKHVRQKESQKAELFSFLVEDKKIEAELAVKPSERAKGLMHRDHLPDGKGMLFVFEKPGPQKFWMKNTRIPLDIGYFSPDGKLLEVHAAKPYDLSGAPSRSDNIQFVLELNGNGFRKSGIRIGDRLRLSEISQALRSSGFNPSEYGLP